MHWIEAEGHNNHFKKPANWSALAMLAILSRQRCCLYVSSHDAHVWHFLLKWHIKATLCYLMQVIFKSQLGIVALKYAFCMDQAVKITLLLENIADPFSRNFFQTGSTMLVCFVALWMHHSILFHRPFWTGERGILNMPLLLLEISFKTIRTDPSEWIKRYFTSLRSGN